MAFALPTNMLDSCTEGFVYCYAKWASNVTGGLFWVLGLLSFVVIILIASMRFGTPRAYGFASFTGLTGGIFLAMLQLIPWWVASIFIINGVVGLAVFLINEKN